MKNRILLLFVTLILPVLVYGQNFEEFTKEIYIWNNQQKLPYRQFKPKNNSKKYPLVILLHGIGERGSDNEKQIVNNGVGAFLSKVKDNYPAIIVAPQCPYSSDTSDKSYWTNAITETPKGLEFDLKKTEPTIPMQMLMSFINDLINSGEVDTEQVYLGGISMGAFGVYELLWRMPNVFKAAFPICGASTVDSKRLETYTAKTRIWSFHGSSDNVVPFQLGNNTYNAIQQIPGSRIKYTVYDGVYHNSWDYAFNEQKLIPWIFGYNNIEKGYYKICTSDSLNNSLMNNGNSICLNPFVGKNNQQWLISDGEIAGTYRIFTADGSNLFLTSNGTDLSLNNYIYNNTQLWKILESDGTYLISSAQNNYSLNFDSTGLKLSAADEFRWKITPSKLFIVGNAINSGWNVATANEMALQSSHDGIFKWTGVILGNGLEFKFLTTRDTNWIPTVNAAYSNGAIEPSEKEYKLAINTNYKNDYKFSMKNTGIYEVTVDMVNRKMSVKKNYQELYLVGEVSPSGWDSYNGIKLKKIDRNVFEWSGYLKAGAFKFLTQKGSWLYSLSSYFDNEAISVNDSSKLYAVKFNANLDANFNYKLPRGGFYKIKLDLNKDSMSILRKDVNSILMTGSAIKNDTIEIAQSNLYDGLIYKYTGNIEQGSLQFIIENPFSLDSLQYINTTASNNSILTSSNIKLAETSDWLVSQSNQNYRIIIDLDQLLLKGEIFVPRSSNYYLVGGASSDQWDINKATPFVQDVENPNIYTLRTKLEPKSILNGNQFKILQQKNWWGYSFHPMEYNKSLTNSTQVYEEQYGYGGSTDYKWTIDSSNAGDYLITLNLLDQTISFDPQLSPRSIESTNADCFNSNISILTIDNQVLIKNRTDVNIDKAMLIEIGTGKIYSEAIDKVGDFYLGENIPFGIYIVNIIQGKLTQTKKIIIK